MCERARNSYQKSSRCTSNLRGEDFRPRPHFTRAALDAYFIRADWPRAYSGHMKSRFYDPMYRYVYIAAHTVYRHALRLLRLTMIRTQFILIMMCALLHKCSHFRIVLRKEITLTCNYALEIRIWRIDKTDKTEYTRERNINAFIKFFELSIVNNRSNKSVSLYGFNLIKDWRITVI